MQVKALSQQFAQIIIGNEGFKTNRNYVYVHSHIQ